MRVFNSSLAVVLIAVGSCSADHDLEPEVDQDELAITQPLVSPAAAGYTLTVCQSYRSATWSHGSTNPGWPLDIGLSSYCPSGEAAGVPLVAMASGKVTHLRPTPASMADDHMYLALNGGGLILYGHVVPTAAMYEGKSVTQGEVIATIRPASFSNNYQAHLHLEVYAGNCWMCSPQPFSGAYRMGANNPALPANTTSDFYRGYKLASSAGVASDRTSDVTGDGRADLVSVHTSGSAFVWPGLATGGFGGAVASFSGTLNPANIDGSGHFIVGVADVTGDARADLVSVSTAGSAFVWPGMASGGFGAAVSSFNGTYNLANLDGTGHFVVGVADVTGDRKADLVSHYSPNNNVYVYPGTASGAFANAGVSFNGTYNLGNRDGSGHFVVGLADVTGDRQADLVSHYSGSDNVYVYPGTSSATFANAGVSFNGTYNLGNRDGTGHYVVDVADVTGDGRADLVSHYSADNKLYVYAGTGSATFAGGVASLSSFNLGNRDGAGHIVLGVTDVTGDGRADVVTANTTGTAYVYPGLASGAFGNYTASFAGTLDVANHDGSGHYLVGPTGAAIYSASKPAPPDGVATCGDATCDGDETDVSCPDDCGEAPPDVTAEPAADAAGCSTIGGGVGVWFALALLGARRRRRRR